MIAERHVSTAPADRLLLGLSIVSRTSIFQESGHGVLGTLVKCRMMQEVWRKVHLPQNHSVLLWHSPKPSQAGRATKLGPKVEGI